MTVPAILIDERQPEVQALLASVLEDYGSSLMGVEFSQVLSLIITRGIQRRVFVELVATSEGVLIKQVSLH